MTPLGPGQAGLLTAASRRAGCWRAEVEVSAMLVAVATLPAAGVETFPSAD